MFLRRTLVIVQFTLAVVLIINSFIVKKQFDFLYTVNLGYEKENVVIMRINSEFRDKTDILKKELLRHSEIVAAGEAYWIPSNWGIIRADAA